MSIFRMQLMGLMKGVLFGLCAVALVGCASPVESGPIRDKIRENAKARQQARQERRSKKTTSSSSSATQQITLTVNGQNRLFAVHTPPGFDPAASNGAVLVFHGGGGKGSPDQMAKMSNMSQWADSNGFLAVYPDAGDRQWNDGRAVTQSSIDDVAFVHSILDHLAQNFGLDRRRVFATGISNGGMMVQNLACKSPGSFAGLAVIVANMPTNLKGQCRPSSGSNLIFFHGTEDQLMPYGGGEIKKSRTKGAGGSVHSVDETLAFWSGINGCSSKSTKPTVDKDKNDGTTLNHTVYSGCSRTLEAYRINGGGHNWPGSGTRNNFITGRTSREVGASEVMLSFFRSKGL